MAEAVTSADADSILACAITNAGITRRLGWHEFESSGTRFLTRRHLLMALKRSAETSLRMAGEASWTESEVQMFDRMASPNGAVL